MHFELREAWEGRESVSKCDDDWCVVMSHPLTNNKWVGGLGEKQPGSYVPIYRWLLIYILLYCYIR